MDKIPKEIWLNVFKHIDLKTMSSLLITDTYFNKTIESIKWDIIDSMKEKGCPIPKNEKTYFEYMYCIDWMTYVCNNIEIPEDIILKLHDYIDFPVITTKQKFSETLIRKFYNKIPMINLLMFQKVPLDILCPLIDSKIPSFFEDRYWYYIWTNQRITVDFINKYKEYVDWNAISNNKDALSFDIINEFHNQLIWSSVTSHGIHESIIEHFIYKMDSISWRNVEFFSQLSENFIKKYEEKLDIVSLFTAQQMSENLITYFLEKTKDETTLYDIWSKISLNQCLSFEFINKYKDKLNLVFMIRNPRIKRKYLKIIYN